MPTTIPYYNYKGPTLTKATLDNNDIIEVIQNMYGSERNWNNRLWKLNEVFTEIDIGKKVSLEFISRRGSISKYNLTIPEELTIVFNNPIFMPFCDCGNRETCESVVCSKVNPDCDCNSIEYNKPCNRICGNKIIHQSI